MKSLLKDLTALALTQDLTVIQLNTVHNLIEADLITLRNGVASLGALMSVASAGTQAIGQENLGNIGELFSLMANQISALHLLDDQTKSSLVQRGSVRGASTVGMNSKFAERTLYGAEYLPLTRDGSAEAVL